MPGALVDRPRTNGTRRVSYAVKELFLTLQGEGANAGRVAAFCRFAGCNLWTGREQDRASAVCQFCDTDFVGGARYSMGDLARSIKDLWPSGQGDRLAVFTGGEPMLQLDDPLVRAVRQYGFRVAIETNGTIGVPSRLVDWICVSPKAGALLVQRFGSEIKVVFPQEGLDPLTFEGLTFDHFFIQPMDGPKLRENMREAIAFCLARPRWRLSIQVHKVAGLR
jgi:7-carboxy-7-deazaguanine synthase